MNCYTVINRQVQIGIALSRAENDTHLSLTLGKRIEQTGVEKKIILSPRNPASRVLVAGGIHLMRTAELYRTEGDNQRWMFAKAKYGLKTDTTDPRALVLLDFCNSNTNNGYTTGAVREPLISGFEVVREHSLKYRMQSLMLLSPNDQIVYPDADVGITYVVTYDFDAHKDRFPHLSCITLERFKARDKQDFVAV